MAIQGSPYKGGIYNRKRPTKAYSSGTPVYVGFHEGEVTEVVTSTTDPYTVKVSVNSLGHENVPALFYIGSPPRKGDKVMVSFIANRPDDLLVINPQHQLDDGTAWGVVRFGGQTEQFGVTMRIDPTEYVGSNRTSIMLDETIMGTDQSGIGTEGDWYIYDNDNSKYNLSHSGHSNVTNGGLTVRATGTHTTPAGTFERYIGFAPSYDWGGTERGSFFTNNQYGDFTFHGTTYQYGCHPTQNNQYTLGYDGVRWSELFCHNGTINTSDQNEKTDIADSDLGLDFLKALRPVKFKWIETEGRAGVRTHYGLIGQEVETVLGDAASDTAIWTKALIEAQSELPADPERNVLAVPAVEEHYEQGLRYSELVGPIIKAIQELEVRIAALES